MKEIGEKEMERNQLHLSSIVVKNLVDEYVTLVLASGRRREQLARVGHCLKTVVLPYDAAKN